MELRASDSRAVVQSVLAGEVDPGIASVQTVPTPLAATPLLDDPFLVVCRRDDSLAAARAQGITLLPALAVPDTERLTSRQLAFPAPRRTLSILERKDETPAPIVRVLLDGLRQEVERFQSNRVSEAP